MRAALLVAAGAALLGGCLQEPVPQLESVRGFLAAWCEGRVEDVLAFTATPFYLGRAGPQDREQVRTRVATVIRDDQQSGQTSLECPARFDFERAESLTARAIEERYNVTIAEKIRGYDAPAADRYVMVPPYPNTNSDDPIQGFWRPHDDRWRFVAMFND